MIDIDFLEVETIGGLDRFGGSTMEERAFEIKRVGEAVSGVDAHDKGSFAAVGKVNGSGACYAGFPDAAFAAVKKYSHKGWMRADDWQSVNYAKYE
jgi:hypothetical protein